MRRLPVSIFEVALSGIVLAGCAPAPEPRSHDELRWDQLELGQISTPEGVKRMPVISAGMRATLADAVAMGAMSAEGGQGGSGAGIPSAADLGISGSSLGCSARNAGPNVRVNQDCTFRRQAETDIAYNPVEPDNLVSGQNDSRVGFNQTGVDWSLDDGRTHGDLLPPFRQRINDPASEEPTQDDPNRHTIVGGSGTNHTYDAASDPMVAFDSHGRAFYGAVAFDMFTNASLIFVTTSPLGARGSFFLNIPQSGRQFIVAEDNSLAAFHDKPFMTADRYPGSPNQDNVYVTWTVFNTTCGDTGTGLCESPIYGSMSTDHGFTWSTPEVVSGRNPNLCFFGDFFTGNPEDADKCNLSQGSDPEVLANGDLVVVFNNFNVRGPDLQQLGVRCHPRGSSPDGTARLNCEAPTKVGDDVITGEPICIFDEGIRQCIPGPFIRTNDFPRIAVDTESGELFAVWQDYRSGEYDIQISSSTDFGRTWSPSRTVNPDTGLDHYFPAIDIAEVQGVSQVGVSYYRSERVPDENVPAPEFSFGIFAPCGPGGMPPDGATSCAGVQDRDSDYVLSGGVELRTPYAFRVVSPTFRPPDGIQTGFNGDYSGLVINRGVEAHPIWSDTRNVDPYAPLNGVVHDEDVFTDSLVLPSGQGTPGPGTIGSD